MKSTCGIDFIDFFNFLAFIARKRLASVESRGDCELSFGQLRLERVESPPSLSHTLYDLSSIYDLLKLMMSSQDFQTVLSLPSAAERLDTQPDVLMARLQRFDVE